MTEPTGPQDMPYEDWEKLAAEAARSGQALRVLDNQEVLLKVTADLSDRIVDYFRDTTDLPDDIGMDQVVGILSSASAEVLCRYMRTLKLDREVKVHMGHSFSMTTALAAARHVGCSNDE